jgi:hypothetical protein
MLAAVLRPGPRAERDRPDGRQPAAASDLIV